MKVLHLLGGGFSSGAGKAVEALHSQLLAQGVDSHVLGRLEVEHSDAPTLHRYHLWDRAKSVIMRKIMMRYSRARYGESSENIQTIPHLGARPQYYPIFHDADILHVQWIGADSFNTSFWKVLANETRPVVWTLRDMWVMTGGCHFSAACDGFTSACRACPYLPTGSQRGHTQFQYKKTHIPQTATFVSISHHFKSLAEKSTIISQRPHRVIFNSVAPPDSLVPRLQARKALGISPEKIYVGSGALNLNDTRKGAGTLAHVLNNFRDQRDIHWLLFGQNLDKIIDPLPPQIHDFGLVRSTQALGHIYAASDIFVMPSLQESFGKTTAEAMLSATPVIAYDNTPAEDMIEHGKTGWLVPHGDHENFYKTLLSALALETETLASMGRAAQDFARKNFSLESIAKKHIELYAELMRA